MRADIGNGDAFGLEGGFQYLFQLKGGMITADNDALGGDASVMVWIPFEGKRSSVPNNTITYP